MSNSFPPSARGTMWSTSLALRPHFTQAHLSRLKALYRTWRHVITKKRYFLLKPRRHLESQNILRLSWIGIPQNPQVRLVCANSLDLAYPFSFSVSITKRLLTSKNGSFDSNDSRNQFNFYRTGILPSGTSLEVQSQD